ncbi:sulfotransferase family 2 domain-containing protein [Pacificoceanicola onchidii]|uniref:sulfotransferase family 2 domain-containing protein n=1 Tax=Pacificoceanicola onchidii TaxID=2562685 RepID=UPI0010A4B0F5|nr:sulfotransferase family 2 domain-containing protein [Pacificoceanicola onchidii]
MLARIANNTARSLKGSASLALKPKGAKAPCPPVHLSDLPEDKRTFHHWNESFPMTHGLEPVTLVHIGKCGGTSIRRSFVEAGIDVHELHMRKAPLDAARRYVVWVRDPIKRFISAFNHSKSITQFDITGMAPGTATLENCPAPMRIETKIKTGHAYPGEYEYLMAQFETANDLAEALYGPSLKRRLLAHLLMRMPDEHMNKGIGWHLHNGAWVDVYKDNIAAVGRVETFDADFAAMIEDMQLGRDVPLKHTRMHKANLETALSEAAITNLKRFYRNTDYKALETLKRHGFLE